MMKIKQQLLQMEGPNLTLPNLTLPNPPSQGPIHVILVL